MTTSPLSPPAPEIHLWPSDQVEPELPLATDGVQRWIWHNRFGEMLLEVRDGHAFVNGERVEPAACDLGK